MLTNSCSTELGIGDHDVVLVSIHIKSPKPVQSHHKVYFWNRVNLRSKFNELSQQFISLHTTDTPIQVLWDSLCHILKSVLNECVPSKITTGNFKSHG